MASAGIVTFVIRGNWVSGTTNYKIFNLTYYGGSTYIAKNDIPNSTVNPETDTTNWQLFAHGYIADTLSEINGIDASGLLGTIGATVTGQALLDEIADRVMTKLVLKTSISNTQVNDSSKVTGSALTYTIGQNVALKIDKSNFDCGTNTIVPTSANTPALLHINFNHTFTSTPKVVLSPVTSGPGTIVTGVGVSNITTTGFDAYLTRVNTTSTDVTWIAVLQPT